MRVITRESQANRAAGRRGIHQHTAARGAQAVLLCQSLRHLPDLRHVLTPGATLGSSERVDDLFRAEKIVNTF